MNIAVETGRHVLGVMGVSCDSNIGISLLAILLFVEWNKEVLLITILPIFTAFLSLPILYGTLYEGLLCGS